MPIPMNPSDEQKRRGLGCYNMIFFAFFTAKLITMLIARQHTILQSLTLIFFVLLHTYGLLGVLFMKESFIRIFIGLLICGMCISFAVIASFLEDVMYAFDASHFSTSSPATLDAKTTPEASQSPTPKTSIASPMLIATYVIYLLASSFALKFSRELLVDIRQSQDINHHLIELQMNLICSNKDFESQSKNTVHNNSNNNCQQVTNNNNNYSDDSDYAPRNSKSKKQPLYTNHCCYKPVELSVIEEVSFTE